MHVHATPQVSPVPITKFAGVAAVGVGVEHLQALDELVPQRQHRAQRQRRPPRQALAEAPHHKVAAEFSKGCSLASFSIRGTHTGAKSVS